MCVRACVCVCQVFMMKALMLRLSLCEVPLVLSALIAAAVSFALARSLDHASPFHPKTMMMLVLLVVRGSSLMVGRPLGCCTGK